jgi:hypothetical protein
VNRVVVGAALSPLRLPWRFRYTFEFEQCWLRDAYGPQQQILARISWKRDLISITAVRARQKKINRLTVRNRKGRCSFLHCRNLDSPGDNKEK